MLVYNGIFVCEADNGHVAGHVRNLDRLGEPMTHCLYYGMGSRPTQDWPLGYLRQHVVACAEAHENNALKSYGMLKHALGIFGWDRFFRTDVNKQVLEVDWQLVARHDYVGHVIGPDSHGKTRAKQSHRLERMEDPLLREEAKMQLPLYWCPGCAVCYSRRLVQAVVDRGAWFARGIYGEDMLVARVAEDLGIVPVCGVSYISHGQVARHRDA